MITDCFDDKTEPIVNLKDFYGESKHIVDICLIIFSKDIHNHLLDTYECEKIGALSTCGGDIIIKNASPNIAAVIKLSGLSGLLAEGVKA